MKTYKKILDNIFIWALRLAMVLLITMVIIVFTNVVLRYGFSSGIRWSEEVALIIVIWFTFIAMALGVKENLHINITVLPKNYQGYLMMFLIFLSMYWKFLLGLSYSTME